jgi:hypothetical protein
VSPSAPVDRLFVARHAESECNVKGLINADPSSERSPLTARGRLQARSLADRLATSKIEVCVTSGRMLAGTLDSMSVGFIAEQRNENIIEKADLLEVTLTPVPSNPYAKVSAVKNYTDPNDPALWSHRIDEAASTKRVPTEADRKAVDAFVTETRELMVREKLAEAEHANARLVSTTAVVVPVPVRVDARMRPVTS